MRVDLNCDLGEGYGPWSMGDDAAMLDLVTSANVACGFHAGDPDVMLRTCRLARERGVSVGAHPGYRDLNHFGRRPLPASTEELEAMVAYQVGAMVGLARLAGHRASHVKAHGALSNVACEDAEVAGAVARAVRAVDPGLVFVVLPLTELERAGEAQGLTLAREVFADRAYDARGRLVNRAEPGAVLSDPGEVARRVVLMLREGAVPTVDGGRLAVPVDTVCIHGDTPGAVAIARAVRAALDEAGIQVAPFARWAPGGGA